MSTDHITFTLNLTPEQRQELERNGGLGLGKFDAPNDKEARVAYFDRHHINGQHFVVNVHKAQSHLPKGTLGLDSVERFDTQEEAVNFAMEVERTYKVIGVAKDDKSTREKPNPATDYESNLFTQEEADDYVARNESTDNSETYEIEVAS